MIHHHSICSLLKPAKSGLKHCQGRLSRENRYAKECDSPELIIKSAEIMKSNLRIIVGSLIATAAGLSGCYDAGKVLAEESTTFAICSLEHGQSCQLTAPAGTKASSASLVSTDDAIRLFGSVSSTSECESFAANSKVRSSKFIAQATINNTVVAPFGEVIAQSSSIKTACATPPFKVSLTVAKAP